MISLQRTAPYNLVEIYPHLYTTVISKWNLWFVHNRISQQHQHFINHIIPRYETPFVSFITMGRVSSARKKTQLRELMQHLSPAVSLENNIQQFYCSTLDLHWGLAVTQVGQRHILLKIHHAKQYEMQQRKKGVRIFVFQGGCCSVNGWSVVCTREMVSDFASFAKILFRDCNA